MHELETVASGAASADPLHLPHLWALDPEVTYVNHGAFGSVPRSVLAEQRLWQDRIDANPMGFYRRVMDGRLDESRLAVARFLGADDDGVAFTLNATTGVATVMSSFPLSAGDRILVTDHVYGPVSWNAQLAAQRVGAEVDIAPVPLGASDEEIVEAITSRVTDRTRLLIVDHISSATAQLFPVEALFQVLHARDAAVFVDAAHAPGALHVDLESLGADFWTGNLHKWACTPRGTAALYASPERRADLKSFPLSWREPEGFPNSFSKIATADVVGWLCAPAAIEFFADLGWDAVRARNNALARIGQLIVAEAIGASLDGMPGENSPEFPVPMRLVPLDTVPAETRDAALTLTNRLATEFGIECPVEVWNGRVLLRVSAQLYNCEADYVKLATALKDLLNS